MPILSSENEIYKLIRIVKKIYLFSYHLHLPLLIQCKTSASGNSDVAYLLGLGYYCHSKIKNGLVLNCSPPPEGIFDTHHKVRRGTFETKMTTHRDK